MNEDLLKKVQALMADPITGKVTTLLIGILCIFGISQSFQKLLVRHIPDASLRYRARKVLQIGSLVLCSILGISIFSERMTELTVAFGLAGAGITIALQEIIISFAGWFDITFGGTYRVGDRVRIGDVRGDVIDIDLMKTTLMELGDWVNGDLYNGKIVRVSNSMVLKSPVYHYSSDYPFLWDEIVIPIRYGSNLKQARQIMNDAAWAVSENYIIEAQKTWDKVVKKYMIEDANLEPIISLTADENWVRFTIRYITDYKQRRSTKDKIFSIILDNINENNSDVKMASAAFEITAFPELTLHNS